MKKRRRRLAIVTGGLIVVALLLYFYFRKAGLRADFLYTRFPAVAGVSTVMNNAATSLPKKAAQEIGKFFKFEEPEASGSTSTPPGLIERMETGVVSKVNEIKNSLIEAGLQKLGYTPTPGALNTNCPAAP